MDTTEKIYVGDMAHPLCSLHVAVTEKGLAFVGSENGSWEEIEQWKAAKRPRALLVEDQDRVASYIEEIMEYLDGGRKEFEIPLDVVGTPFQQEVWNALSKIPYAATAAYSEIAGEIGRPKAVRAVGAAIGANPVMIVVPCHRVVGKNGKLTGFRGGLAMKEKLLELEWK
ncbi:methylated-DNA--[protein]-cysteine S-methyltransferase [Virgibacillus xinjiangensis]|uniref:Methylated-DNA--[protein]-cysteine S-methyltransferase n=1 Tax=Virgibacillus xinjiangensis TaxID=393090 RepID=A0ABV7CXK2_9BACI